MTNNAYLLSLDDVANHKPKYLETIFSLANGHFGFRAGDVLIPSSTATTLVNGFYDIKPIEYGESAFGYAKNHQTIVPLPDLRMIKINDEFGNLFTTSKLLSKSLNMKNGQLTERWQAEQKSGKSILITLISVLDQPSGIAALLKYNIQSINYTGKITVQKIFGKKQTTKSANDPRQSRQITNLLIHEAILDSKTKNLTVSTSSTNQIVKLQQYVKEGLILSKVIKPEQCFDFTVLTEVSEIMTPENVTNYKLCNIDPDELIAHAKKYWLNFWRHSATTIVGNDVLDKAIHYNLFQLASSAGQDGKTNISAKGLSGTGYEGHYFWDTEMYMLPFLTYTNPQIAKKLIEYRFTVLPQAKARARVLGVKHGALFAWRTINGEEASAYYPAGTAQYHIDADIAYAVDRYYTVTGDRNFIINTGLELMIETARFWINFGSYTEKNGKRRFELFDVTGPDEYTAIVNNNYYTNRLAKFNLNRAFELIHDFPKTAAKLHVTKDEAFSWHLAAKAMYLPFDKENKVNAQDDSSFSKPLWPFNDKSKNHYPLLLHYHPLDIYRHQVNKQADTLLAEYLFNDISFSQLARDYSYYEKITTHDSSLSRSIFSALAARLGKQKKAYDYFMDTAQMDLIDMQGNASDGLHIANLGGSWLSIATGFGGVSIQNGLLQIVNHMPREWKELDIRLQFQGRLLNLHYTSKLTEITLLKGQPLIVIINGRKEKVAKI